MPMDLVTFIAAAAETAEGAAEHEEQSETLFLVLGSILAAFAVVVATLGIRKPQLPDRVVRLITLAGIALVVVTAAAMVVIST
jgi:hypothetical protein